MEEDAISKKRNVNWKKAKNSFCKKDFAKTYSPKQTLKQRDSATRSPRTRALAGSVRALTLPWASLF